MSTVLVTGASSPLGRMLIDGLLPAHRVLATVHREPVDTRGGRVELLPDGLERCADFAARIATADVIVHLAAVTHTNEAALYERVNHEFTRRLLAAARPGQRLIYVSTVCAHPEGGAYGVSKLRGEEAVRASGLNWVIVRLSEVYGLESGEGIDELVKLALRARLLADFREGGSVKYAPVSGERVVRFLLDVVNRFVRAKVTYTLCADQPCTALDMATALTRAGRRVTCVPLSVGFLRFLVRLRLPTKFKADQLDRLVLPKDYDLRAAREDYGFEPGDFLRDVATLADRRGGRDDRIRES